VDIVQIKTAEEIRDDILAEISALTGISDSNLGATVRTQAFAVAVEIDELYFQLWKATKGFYIKTATGTALDNRAADFNLARRAATAAIGTVTFTGTPAATIPINTLVAAPATAARDEIVFQTTASGIVGGGGTVDIAIEALKAGEEGNLTAAQITTIKTTVSGVTAVTNAASTVLGTDKEGDSAFRESILRTIAGLSRGTIPAILHGAIDFALQEVTLYGDHAAGDLTLYVVEDLNLYPFSITGTNYIWLNETEAVSYTGISTASFPHSFTGITRAQKGTAAVAHDDGVKVKEYVDTTDGQSVTSASLIESPGVGQVDVYIDDGTTTGPSTELVDVVQKRLRGDGTDRDPGYRGAGITLYVIARTVTQVNVTATIVAEPGYNLTATATTSINAVTDFLNGHKVGQNVFGYQVAEEIMAVEGVQTILSLIINTVTFVGTSTADVVITNTEVARANTISVS